MFFLINQFQIFIVGQKIIENQLLRSLNLSIRSFGHEIDISLRFLQKKLTFMKLVLVMLRDQLRKERKSQ